MDVKKAQPVEGYPPEPGCYLRGNDFSPVAVAVILKWVREQTPPEIEELVRVAVEGGAALAGTLQTENIGIEKVICNIVANPNIRYLIVCGPESPGHSTGEALLCLGRNGIDERKRIIGTQSPTPYLFNVSAELVQRFRDQIQVLDLLNEGSPDVLRTVVWTCYQEKPTRFRNYELFDPGAYPKSPLSSKITWRITQPQKEPKTEEEAREMGKVHALMERIRKTVADRAKGRKDP